MSSLLKNNPLLFIILVVGFLTTVGLLAWQLYEAGKDAAKVEQVQTVVKAQTKAKKAYDKIDRETPFNSDKSTAIDWLSKHTSGN